MAEGKTKQIRIRQGRQGDAVAIFRLLQEAYGHAQAPWPALDDDRLMVWVVDTLANGEVWVADLSGRVVGSVALVPFQFPWSSEWVLSNRWLYVLEKFRARGTGKALIQAVTASADAKNAPLVIGTHSGNNADWKDEFLGGFEGMVYGGGSFFRPAGGVNHG